MTLCIGQLHPITIYKTNFWVCVVLVLSVIVYSFTIFFIYKVQSHHDFHHNGCDNYWDFYGNSFQFELQV